MSNTHLFEDVQSHTRAKELAEMLGSKLAERASDMLLNSLGLCVRLSRVVWNER